MCRSRISFSNWLYRHRSEECSGFRNGSLFLPLADYSETRNAEYSGDHSCALSAVLTSNHETMKLCQKQLSILRNTKKTQPVFVFFSPNCHIYCLVCVQHLPFCGQWIFKLMYILLECILKVERKSDCLPFYLLSLLPLCNY